VSPDTALDNLFQNYGNSGTGSSWTGGDGTDSVALPDGRELWFFDDSLLGTVTNGQRLFHQAAFLHNSLIVESNGALTKTYFTLTPKAPEGATAFLSLRPDLTFKYGFWPAAAVVNGNSVQVIGTERVFARAKYGTERSLSGAYIATLGLPDLAALGFQRLPVKLTRADWVGGVLTDGGYTYIYLGLTTRIAVARVVGTNLGSPWTFYDGNGWSPHFSKAVAVESIGFENHFSVIPIGSGNYLFIERDAAWSNDIMAAIGCSPAGPFGSSETIYTAPEPSTYPASYGGVGTYDAQVHPELSTSPNTLLASYDVNFVQIPSFEDISDASVYRPRFLQITVTPG